MTPLTQRPLEAAISRVEQASILDAAAGPLAALGDRAIPTGPVRSTLQGAQLGHPLHPLLTDIPIGLFTSASLLDLGGPRSATAARRFVGLGLLSALPTVAAGLADWMRLDAPPARRVGLVHAGANALGLACYLSSYRARSQSRWLKGAAMSVVGMTVMSVGGYLGGGLIFNHGAGVGEQAPSAAAGDDWPSAIEDLDFTPNHPLALAVDGDIRLGER